MGTEKHTFIQLPETWATDWVIESRLGSGSFSTVYRAVRRDHPGLDAAIKVISIPSNDNERETLRTEGFNESQSQQYYDEITRQYIAEIEIMESLKGTQHIVGIEDYKVVRREDVTGNRIFIRMELLRSLDSILQQRNLDEKEIVHLGTDICSALEFCEAKQIIHRDIKPANIFINDKTPGYFFYKLGDFGIARNTDALTHGLSTKGTPTYMAPEVFFGKPYDSRADLYSLGITLYRLLNQNRPPFVPANGFSASAREEAMRRRLSGEALPPPSEARPALSRVILKACAYKPEDRYRTAAEMHRDLENALQDTPNPESHPLIDEKTIDAPLPDFQITPPQDIQSAPTPEIQVFPPHVPDYDEPTEVMKQTAQRKKRFPVWARVALPLAAVAVCTAVILLVRPFDKKDESAGLPAPTAAVLNETEEPTATAEPVVTEESITAELPLPPAEETQQEFDREETPVTEKDPETAEKTEPEEETLTEEKTSSESEENAGTAEPGNPEDSSETPDTADRIILTADRPEVLTHQPFTLSGFAPGARHLRIELREEENGQAIDWREGDGGVIEAEFGQDHAAFLQAVLIADYDDSGEPRYSEPVKISVKAEGSTGPLTIICDPVVKEGNPLTGKIYAEHAGWYYVWLDRIDNQRTRLSEYDAQPDSAGYASFYFEPSILEKGGIYEIGVSANREGKNSTHLSAFCIVTGENVEAHPVTLTVDGKTEDGTCLAYQMINTQADAPGASALRIFNGNSWEVEYNRDSLNRQWFFGSGQQILIAEASYDPVDWVHVDRNIFDANRELHWDSISNPIRLELIAPYGQADGAEFTLNTENPIRGEFLEVTLERPSGTSGAAYSLWLDRQREENGEIFWDYIKQIDWYEDHGLISTMSLEPGHYRFVMETHAAGYNAVTCYAEFDLTEGEGGGEPVCRVLRDAQRACETNVFFCTADGADRITLQIRRDGDSGYREEITVDGGDGRWDLFPTKTDCYRLTPVIYMAETDEQGNRLTDEATGEPRYQELRGETVTITVKGDGDLQAPVIESLPVIHPCGEPLEFGFDLPAEAQYCSISLLRIPDSGDWIQLLFKEGSPEEVKARTGTIPSELLSEPGLYRLGVYTNAPGLNDADTASEFMVVSGKAGEKISLTLNGSREETIHRRAGEEIPLTISAPGADAIRLLDGNWNWQHIDKRALNEKGEFFWTPVYNSGSYLIAVQACYDTGIDWDTVDLNTFDWTALDWSETSNAMRIEVTAEGKLQVPTVTLPETMTRGEWAEVEIGEVSGAETYTLWIDPLNPEGNPDGPTLVCAIFTTPGKQGIPTAGLVAGNSYGLHVTAGARGYDNGDTPYYPITVTGDEPGAEFRIEPDHVQTGEQFLVSVWAPGAASVKLCHERPDNVWSEQPSIASPFTCGEPGEYVFKAYAYDEKGQKWQQIGKAITVWVTADQQQE